LQWDTAGQERFRTITTSYFRGADGFLILYDVGDEESFQHARTWHAQIQQHADRRALPAVVLVGNVSDEAVPRVVSTESGEAMARELGGLTFIETNVRTGTNVEEAFIELARKAIAAKDQAARAASDAGAVSIVAHAGSGQAAAWSCW
jgi:small GTP-binding protein